MNFRILCIFSTRWHYLEAFYFLLQMAARYDPDMEDEVLGWIKDLTGEDVPGGQREVERALRSGVVLVK